MSSAKTAELGRAARIGLDAEGALFGVVLRREKAEQIIGHVRSSADAGESDATRRTTACIHGSFDAVSERIAKLHKLSLVPTAGKQDLGVAGAQAIRHPPFPFVESRVNLIA